MAAVERTIEGMLRTSRPPAGIGDALALAKFLGKVDLSAEDDTASLQELQDACRAVAHAAMQRASSIGGAEFTRRLAEFVGRLLSDLKAMSYEEMDAYLAEFGPALDRRTLKDGDDGKPTEAAINRHRLLQFLEHGWALQEPDGSERLRRLELLESRFFCEPGEAQKRYDWHGGR